MSDLPRRPFTPLPAPLGGADAAVLGGRRRRQRRRAAQLAVTAAAAVAVGVVLAPGGGQSGAARVVTVSPSANPTATATTTAAGRPAGQPTTAAATLPSSSPSPGPAAPSSPVATAAAETPRALPAYRPAPFRRSYTAADPTGARVCGTRIESGQSRIDWCVDAVVTATASGHDLAVQVCRDQTTAATLHLPAGLPAELAVSDGQSVVWRWSAGQPAEPAQALTTPAGACWTWTTAWTDVDGRGRPLDSGQYSLVATSNGVELGDVKDSQPVTFRL